MSEGIINILKDEIRAQGPMRLDWFMELVLSHPRHGYYMTRDPLGRGGDFTTAPEVSQMFGEMIGAWAADTWMKMGSPSRFVLLECGPGRGTLMGDMMRAVKHVPGFHEACSVHLLEMSPVLMKKQALYLEWLDPGWSAALADVPPGVPMIVIGNEFLDALPVRQVVWKSGAWRERVVDIDGVGFSFGDEEIHEDFEVEGVNALPKEGEIYEFSSARRTFMRELDARLTKQGGAALFIDYGHAISGFGDTLQAVHQHKYCGVFENVGDADLTAHVDFGVLERDLGAAVDGIVTQGEFLKRLGIEMRTEILAKKDPGVAKDLHRLVNSGEMGALFKVMGARYGFGEKLAGF